MIGHCDCNNFYVSCFRVFMPKLEGRPVGVLSSGDGCLVARSNELKALGVPNGIPVFQLAPGAPPGRFTEFGLCAVRGDVAACCGHHAGVDWLGG